MPALPQGLRPEVHAGAAHPVSHGREAARLQAVQLPDAQQACTVQVSESKKRVTEYRASDTSLFFIDIISLKYTPFFRRHNKIHRRSRLKELSAQSGSSREEEDAEDCLYEHCEHCGKRFACGTALKQHVNYVHKKVFDNVKCEECGQNFERRTQLNR